MSSARARRSALVASIALVASAAVAGPAQAAPVTLFADAFHLHPGAAGPDDRHVGHRQLGSGVMRDAEGRVIGHASFTCVWVRILAGGDDAMEHCTSTARTADGVLRLAGPSRRSDETHTWSVAGGTGRYRGARGTIVVRDLGITETLGEVTITPRAHVRLRAGVIPRPPANAAFIARVGGLCDATARELAKLPRFPFDDFDPHHPDPAVLPQVGAFFTGPGDPRPALDGLIAALRAAGAPPANRAAWDRALAARVALRATNDEQDTAALAGDVAGFVRSVDDVDSAFRAMAITATVFGVSRCVV